MNAYRNDFCPELFDKFNTICYGKHEAKSIMNHIHGIDYYVNNKIVI